MKKTATLMDKLLRLARGETLPASSLKGDWFEQMQADGILVTNIHGSHKSLRATSEDGLRHYLASQYDIRDLEETSRIIEQDEKERALQVHVTGDSKFLSRRTFQGFLVNSYQPIPAMLSGKTLTIEPPDGCFLFISDFQSFAIPNDVVVLGVENAENFRHIRRQQCFFEHNVSSSARLLFVSRYPQSQHSDLINWLQSIPNRYVHFGDLDLAGIAIYQNEYYRHLGERSSFLIPEDYEQRLSNGNAERYNVQLRQYGSMIAKDTRLSNLLSYIHRCHRGYDQEGFIE